MSHVFRKKHNTDSTPGYDSMTIRFIYYFWLKYYVLSAIHLLCIEECTKYFGFALYPSFMIATKYVPGKTNPTNGDISAADNC